MFYFEINGKRLDDINSLTLAEVKELLSTIKGLELKYDKNASTMRQNETKKEVM